MNRDPSLILNNDLLAELERRLARVGAPIVNALRPGLTDDEIDELSEPLGLRVGSEARTWWRWRTIDDDVRGSGTRDLTGRRWEFMTLAEAVKEASYRIDLEAAEKNIGARPASYQAWRVTWVPLYRNSHAALAVVDSGGADAAEAPVYYVDPPDSDASSPPTVRSLGRLVAWWLEAFDAGAYYYNAQTGRLAAHRGWVRPELENTRLV